MRTKNFKYDNKNVVQVYITKEEATNNVILDNIEKFKKENGGNVAVFIAGDTDTIPQLEQMVLHHNNKEKL